MTVTGGKRAGYFVAVVVSVGFAGVIHADEPPEPTEAETAPEPTSEPTSEPAAESKPEPEPEPDPQHQPTPEAELDLRPEPESKPKTDPQLEPRSGSQRPKPEKKSLRRGVRWLPRPQMDFNTDTGLGYGIRFELFDYGKRSKKPYEYQLWLQFFQTTRDISRHRLVFDWPWIRGSKWRLSGGFHYVTDFRAPWYGLDPKNEYNQAYTSCDDRDALALDPDVCPGNPDFRGLFYYSYQISSPRFNVAVRYQYDGPWQLYGGYRLRFAAIQPRYDASVLGQTGDSRLLEDVAAGEPIVGLDMRPDGTVALARLAELQIGGVYDTRDHEPIPSSGSWHDLSLRLGSPVFGGRYWYWGITLNVRHYRPLDAKQAWVLAVRGIVDASGGDVPFFQLSRVGGLEQFDGLGGYRSVRGLPRNRHVGKFKLIGNAEVRWRGWSWWFYNHRLDVGAMAGIDAGRVWRNLGPNGSPFAISVATIAGFRAIFDESFVMAIDHAYLLSDGVRATYLNMRHMF